MVVEVLDEVLVLGVVVEEVADIKMVTTGHSFTSGSLFKQYLTPRHIGSCL